MSPDPAMVPVVTNDVTLRVAMAGRRDGRLIIFLHGFPEFWFCWRKQIPFFAEKGFCVWVPDQRGYNQSDKPTTRASYRIDVLARDVAGLIDAAGRERAIIVGHDWGAAVAWRVAQDFPERVEKLVVMNGPHPGVMRRALRSDAKQRRKSWYIFFFQLPVLPELLLGGSDFARLARSLARSARPDTFDEAMLSRYRAAWREPGAMRAMLEWYRAIRLRPPRPRHRRVAPPTLILWGRRDAFLEVMLAERSLARCDAGRLVVFEEGTHWLHVEEAERVNREVASFLDGG
jgi:pimeloyl-ACP methyl ester carboxylesterase